MEKVVVFLGDQRIGVVACDSGHVKDVVVCLVRQGAACCSALAPEANFEGDCVISNNAIAALKRIEPMIIKPMIIKPLRDNFDLISIREPKPVYKERYAKRHHQKNSW